MLIGLVGAPNKGKSTLFSAITTVDAEIADYPFTTIKPNMGVGYVAANCPESAIGAKCNPRNSLCSGSRRMVPISIIDVAGLVPGASLGKGMGTQFLNDLIAADALIQVVDVSGKSDLNGNPCDWSDPSLEVEMVFRELTEWVSGIITRHAASILKRQDGAKALTEVLSGFGTDVEEIEMAASANNLSLSSIKWDADSVRRFSSTFLKLNKPIAIAANKLDKAGQGKLTELKKKLEGYNVIGCSGEMELALRKASKNGTISYAPGSDFFNVKTALDSSKSAALSYILDFIKRNGGTGVDALMNAVVFGLMEQIVVYPVENENKWTDRYGNVLPDAILMDKGSTAMDLARKVHTEMAEHMLYAINARTKERLSKEYRLADGDVIKIVSSK